jgi:hypothetical protein
MHALPGPRRRVGPGVCRQGRPEPLAIPRPQEIPIPQSPPLEFGNIVETAIVRLIGAVLLEANDEWQLQHRYIGVEAMGEMLNPPPTSETLQLPPKAA